MAFGELFEERKAEGVVGSEFFELGGVAFESIEFSFDEVFGVYPSVWIIRFK